MPRCSVTAVRKGPPPFVAAAVDPAQRVASTTLPRMGGLFEPGERIELSTFSLRVRRSAD